MSSRQSVSIDSTATELEQAHDQYMSGLERGVLAGIIEYAKPEFAASFGPGDMFKHLSAKGNGLGGLRPSNTRPLSQEATDIFNCYQGLGQVRVLEAGAGAGVAATAIATQFPDFTLHTLGRTPINPYLALRQDYKQIQQAFHRLAIAVAEQQISLPGLLATKLELVLNPINPLGLPHFTVFPVEFILALQAHVELNILEERVAPFIAHQFIGTFPNDFSTPTPYDIYHDDSGPIVYNFRTPHLEEPAVALRVAIEAVSDRGVLIFNFVPAALVQACELEAQQRGLVLKLPSPQNSLLVLAKPNSPVLSKLKCMRDG
ncbi:MAG: hypothetical protein F6K19_13765 [Cyanothece sp. SIO1E1]|nr:hypothetical protein [Cyanothece sp. SIO1E1]